MKKAKITLICVILFLCAGLPAFSQLDFNIGKLKNTMEEFQNNLAKSLPFNSSMGLNWADAYIGNFPRFGVGFSVGLTTMDMGSFQTLLDIFAPALPGWLTGSGDNPGFGGFPIPGYAVEARMGGFVLPFDVGFKFGLMPLEIKQLNKFDYFLIGGDFRYAVLKGNVILPTVSVGVGFNYLSGTLGMKAGSDRTFSYPNPNPLSPGDTLSVTMKAPEFTVDWSTASLDFKAQISKSFLVVTPYFGVGASTGWSKAGYDVTMKVEDSTGTLEEARKIFKQVMGIDLSDKGFSSETDPMNGWSFRMFGGLTFNIAVVRIELTGFYNFVDKYGATFGVRVQL